MGREKERHGKQQSMRDEGEDGGEASSTAMRERRMSSQGITWKEGFRGEKGGEASGSNGRGM